MSEVTTQFQSSIADRNVNLLEFRSKSPEPTLWPNHCGLSSSQVSGEDLQGTFQSMVSQSTMRAFSVIYLWFLIKICHLENS